MGGSKFLQNEVKNMVLCIARYYVLLYICAKVVNSMYAENVKSQMRKGTLEYCILLLLKKEPAYTSDIIQKLQTTKLIVVEGTLYPLLTRLKNSGFLSYQWIESTQGPPRKYYQLTETGEEFLKELETSWQELNNTINHIKNN